MSKFLEIGSIILVIALGWTIYKNPNYEYRTLTGVVLALVLLFSILNLLT